jgi:hypothetical protein
MQIAMFSAEADNPLPIEVDDEAPEALPPDLFFNPWRKPLSSAATEVVEAATRAVEGYEVTNGLRQRKRRHADQQTFEATVSAIISDVLHAHLKNDTRGIATTRSHKILGKGDRYSAPALNQGLPSVLDALAGVGWIKQDKGFEHPFAKRNQRTLIRAGNQMVEAARLHSLTSGEIGKGSGEEVIILKAPKSGFWDQGSWMPYVDTDVTDRYRKEVTDINAWLASADIEFWEDASIKDRPIDTDDRQLQRFFTRGRFDNGGRLFGGFWQGLKKEERLEGLEIDGESVAILDYGQMAPRILYGLAGAVPPEGDLYAIPGLTDLPGGPWREGIKKMMNSLTFSDDIKRKPRGTKDLLPALPIDRVITLIKEAHPAIAHFLGSEIGHHVQFIESEIMVRILLRLEKYGVVGLPVHDGIIVSRSAAGATKEAMLAMFLEATCIEANVETVT